MRDEALTQYRLELLIWAATAPRSATKIKSPEIPKVLKDG